jgi:hypothetical protein
MLGEFGSDAAMQRRMQGEFGSDAAEDAGKQDRAKIIGGESRKFGFQGGGTPQGLPGSESIFPRIHGGGVWFTPGREPVRHPARWRSINMRT